MDLEKAEEPEINCQHPLDHRKSKGIQKKKIYLYFIDSAKAIDSVNHSKIRKILRDGNTRPPYQPPEESVSSSKKQWLEPENNILVPNWERSMSRLYIVTLFI